MNNDQLKAVGKGLAKLAKSHGMYGAASDAAPYIHWNGKMLTHDQCQALWSGYKEGMSEPGEK